MPLYNFRCDECDRGETLYGKMVDPPKRCRCLDCGKYMYREFGARAQVFKPFKTDQITGEMIEIKTPQERDRILKENKLTMDPVRYVRKKKFVGSAERITLGDVKEAIESGRGGKVAAEIEGLPIPDPADANVSHT